MSSQNVPLWQQMLAKRREWLESQPSLSGQVASMFREAAKDVRSTEPGSPGNPTQYMVNQDLGTVHGNYDHSLDQAAEHGSRSQQLERFER
jgi:hypothetical protein